MMPENANWDKIWSKKFVYGHLSDWESDIFVNISLLLKDTKNPQILSAGCGRGLIDYWLISVFGYKVALLDSSIKCIKNLSRAFKKVNKDKFELRHASILSIPYPDNSFDLVWNEGVLEHFHKDDYERAVKEMVRVSRKYILIDVPYARSKPYTMAKKWLEENGLWVWGYEDPKVSLKEDLEANGVNVLKEVPIGSTQTNRNYINMIPADKREQVLKLLAENDFKVYPHLMTIGEKKRLSNRFTKVLPTLTSKRCARARNRIKLAEHFLLVTLRNGLAHSYDVEKNCWVKPYPETTGYLLSYFSEYFHDVPPQILSAAENLCKIQHRTGGYFSFNNKRYLYTFDTAQIMHGFASLYKKTNEKRYLDVAKKCAEFIIEMQIDNGAMFPVYDTRLNTKYVNKKGGWGMNFSYIQVKNIEGLLLIYELSNDSRCMTSAVRLRDYGKKHCDLTFTHPGAYCLEGMLAIGEKDFVYNKLRDEIVPTIQPNGFLPYSKELSYSYVSGSVQMGILLYKVGLKKYAHSILEWSRKVQSNHNSGGLFQYANSDGTLNHDIHTEINSWGTKYYAQLERLFNES